MTDERQTTIDQMEGRQPKGIVRKERAAIYARVSTPRQVKQYSLDRQEAACREYAASRGWEIEERCVVKEAISGALLERPGILRLSEAAAQGAFTVLLCEAVDRLTRGGISHGQCLQTTFALYGVRVVLLDCLELSAAQLELIDSLGQVFLAMGWTPPAVSKP